MSKCKDCKHNDREYDCYCGQCIHAERVDNFEPKQWQPKHSITSLLSGDEYSNQFVFRQNFDKGEQAEDLAKRLKQLATLHAWASELPEGDGRRDFYIYFDDEYLKWQYTSELPSICELLMTETQALKTCEALNTKYLELE